MKRKKNRTLFIKHAHIPICKNIFCTMHLCSWVQFKVLLCHLLKCSKTLWAKLSVQNRQEWETQCDAEKHLAIVLFPQKGLFHAKSNESPIGQEGFTWLSPRSSNKFLPPRCHHLILLQDNGNYNFLTILIKKLFEGGNFRWIFSQTLFDQILDPFLFHYTALLSHSNHLDQLLYCWNCLLKLPFHGLNPTMAGMTFNMDSSEY